MTGGPVTGRPAGAADAKPGRPAGPADPKPGEPQDLGTGQPQDQGTGQPQDLGTGQPQDQGTGQPQDQGSVDLAAPGGPAGVVSAARRHNRWKTGFFLLAIFGVIAAAAWALLGSRFLVVRSIEVTGTRVVPKSEVLAAAAIPAGLPLARVNTSAVAHRIERIAQVQSAAVTRNWPDRIVITVRERQAALAVASGPEFDLIDPYGVVVRQVAKRPANLPLFTLVGPALGNPAVRAAASVMRSLPSPLARLVRSVTVPAAGAVTLHLSTGVTVDWGSPGQSGPKARELTILMHTHARYYDVSAPGTAATSR